MTLVASVLPSEFYDASGLEPTWQALRTQILGRLVSEREGCDTLDSLLIERASYLYAHVRQKEASEGGFANDRAYKETFQLLVAMLQDLRRVRDRELALDEAKYAILQQVAGIVKEAVSDLAVEEQQVVLGRVVSLLEHAA
jgi:hypothetical protein